ncbi:MAG: FmdB family zinc ribbon protein [Planctomycetota bacterium]|jgi:putative FmdB family regulatory protein
MPTYEYMCENCGHRLERFQSITARPIRICPACGKRELKRLIGSGAGIIFKGSGFYQTDYRSENYKNAEKSEKKPDTAKKETKAETKDAKPAEKNKKDSKAKTESA